MNHLFREHAPVSAAAWEQIESEARRTLKTMLAARRMVDFAGAQGWEASAIGTGRTEPVAPPVPDGVEARVRRVLPFVELRALFDMRRDELDAADRGAKDIDTDPVTAAARNIAIAEDRAVFHGHGAAGLRGICETETDSSLQLGEDFEAYPVLIAVALNRLRDRGVGGPYAVALSEQCYTGLTEGTKGGYPVLEHVRRLLDGPLVWAPGLDGAVVLSMRGEDFELTVGEDFAIGYLDHDAEKVRLYIEESFTFWLLSPQAGIPLVHRAAAAAAPRPTPRARAA